jgi:hypothetical protein
VNTAQNGDTIVLAGGVTFSPGATLNVTQSNLTITGPTSGSGATITGGNVTTPGFSGADDIIDIEPNASLTLENLTVTGALSSGSGGSSGIDVFGSLDMENVGASGNSNAVIRIEFSDGVGADGTAVIRNSTIANNSFSDSATAVDVFGDAKLFNTTLDHNDTGVFMDGGTAELTNTIVANSKDGNCPGGPVTSSVKSFDTDGQCGLDLPSANPQLNPLATNGGTTLSEAPKPGSPAVNAGTNSPCPPKDQRYANRDAQCDVGAVEALTPVITTPGDLTAEATGPGGAAVTFTVTATDGVGGPALPAPACTPTSGSTFPLGTTTVQCTSTDGAGFSSTASFHVKVQDTTGPTIGNVPADITADATSSSGATVTYTNPTATDAVDGTDPVTCSPPSGSTFPLGTTTVNCTATDHAGNSSSASFHVTVQSTTAPTITVPTDFTVEATGTTTPVTYAASASDPVGIATFSCTPASGTSLPLGTTTVTCSATDNVGNSSSASFHITVHDTTAPVITTPGNLTVEATGTMTPVIYAASASDAVGVTGFSCTPASGSPFPLGTTPVSCTAGDAAGNTSSASFNVTVQDTTGPVLGLPANISDTTTDPFGKVETYTATSNDAVDGSLPVLCDPASGSKFLVGTTTVGCSATDAHGNTSSGSFTVHISRTAPATIAVASTAQLQYIVRTLVCGDVLNLQAGNYAPDAPLELGCNATVNGPATGFPGATISGGAVNPTCPTCPDDVIIVDPAVTATIRNITLTLAPSDGTGIDVFGTADVDSSDVAGTNTVGITGEIGSSVTIRNSTIAVNHSAGVDVFGDGQLFNDTLSGNGFGVFLESSGTVEGTNTIVAGNTRDCNVPLTSNNHDLDKDGTCGAALTANPKLGALTSNGGSTLTEALLANSPAIDAGTSTPCPATDQRGVARDAMCDIGAYEYVDTTPPVITVPADITAEATGPGGAIVMYSASASDDTAVASFSCTPASGSTFAITTTTVTCNATDTHGNSSSKSFHVTVKDTTPPVISAHTDVTAEATSPAGAIVSYTTPTATDAVDVTDPVTCTPASGTPFPLGSTAVDCSATDAAGNTGHSSFHVIVVDTTPPAIAPHGDVGPVEATAPLTPVSYTTPTATDAVDGTDPVTCTPASGAGFPVGTTPVTCSSTDAHGNTSHSTFDVTVVDTTAPAITVPADFTVEATGTMTPVTYSASASDAVGVTSFNCTPPSGSSFALGTTTVTCTATDAAGNTSSASFHVTVHDTTAPAITVPADFSVAATGTLTPVTYAASASDAVGVTSFDCTPPSGTGLPLGTTTVTCTAGDAAGNSSSKSFHVTVVNSNPPVIAPHADVTAEATSSAGATVTYTNPTATDVIDGTDPVTCTPSSGSAFALGSTEVDCSATDSAGLTGHSSFHVIVVDTTAPAIAPHGDVGPVEATAPLTPVSYTTPTATDAVDGNDPVTCTPASGAGFPVGTTPVTCSSTDGHGNTSHSTFDVTVVDTTAPAITAPNDIGKEATGPMTPVTYTATASDAVGVTSLVCTPASGSGFPLGTTTVTCTASDAAGNHSSASFNVTIVDTTPPVMTGVPANITVSTGNPAGAVVTYTNPTASDLVDGPVAVTCTPASGSTFPVGTTTVNCVAADSHGNSVTKSFTVTVTFSTESTPPVISGLPGNTSREATGPYGVHFTFNITVKDPDDAGTFSCTGGPVANFDFPVNAQGNKYSYTVTAPVGVDTITCNATDTHGNNATPKSFVLTVTDHTPPMFGPAPNVTVNATSPSGAVVNYTVPTATDLVDGSVTVTCTPAPGSLFHNGGTTVNCSASDSHGNTAHKSFNVTVLSANDQLNALKSSVSRAPELRPRAVRNVQELLMKDLEQAGQTNTTKACQALAKFISDVQAHTPPITAADNSAWIAAAQAIELARGC